MVFYCTIFSNLTFRHSVIIYRYIRNISRRGDPKLLKGDVKTIKEYDDDFSNVSNYQDFVKHVKSMDDYDEIEIEKALLSEDGFAAAPSKRHSDKNIGDDPEHKMFIKKIIIGKKYFKMQLETNLLTHAAKEQIRYLHRTNPDEWTPEHLSQSFPITVQGVKKLLKSNYVIKNPERIKQHDEEVEERWKALESGEYSELISPYTQRMWNERKITKLNYKSNPNLPIPHPDTKAVVIENKISKGEYSAIIEQYMNYKKEKDSSPIKSNAANELLVSDGTSKLRKNEKNENQFKFNLYKYHVDDETDSSDHKKHSTNSKRSKYVDEADVLHSQFKINLKNEKCSKKFTTDPETLHCIEDQSTIKNPESRKPFNSEIFTKIPKFKKESLELKRDASKSEESFYLYDDTIGYHHPKGKIIKDTIDLPRNSRKRNTYKVGQCVYDKNGEFLYKIPVKKRVV